MGKQIESIPNETMDALSRYSWPGNIREHLGPNAFADVTGEVVNTLMLLTGSVVASESAP
jgi:transcriptional regulator with PAS, ATPase and Fis domain